MLRQVRARLEKGLRLGLGMGLTDSQMVKSYQPGSKLNVLTLPYLTFGVDRLYTCPALRLYQLGPMCSKV